MTNFLVVAFCPREYMLEQLMHGCLRKSRLPKEEKVDCSVPIVLEESLSNLTGSEA